MLTVFTKTRTFFPLSAIFTISSNVSKMFFSNIFTLCLLVLSIVSGSLVFTSKPSFSNSSFIIWGSVAVIIRYLAPSFVVSFTCLKMGTI